jgi:hypothetical protein
MVVNRLQNDPIKSRIASRASRLNWSEELLIFYLFELFTIVNSLLFFVFNLSAFAKRSKLYSKSWFFAYVMRDRAPSCWNFYLVLARIQNETPQDSSSKLSAADEYGTWFFSRLNSVRPGVSNEQLQDTFALNPHWRLLKCLHESIRANDLNKRQFTCRTETSLYGLAAN